MGSAGDQPHFAAESGGVEHFRRHRSQEICAGGTPDTGGFGKGTLGATRSADGVARLADEDLFPLSCEDGGTDQAVVTGTGDDDINGVGKGDGG